MKNKKRYLAIFTLCTLVFTACLLASCGKDELKEQVENTKSQIEKIDVKEYMKKDQKEIQGIIDNAIKELGKAKDIETVEEIVNQFNKKISKFATKKEQIKNLKDNLKKNISKLSPEEKKKAEEIIKTYEKNIDSVNSTKELEDIGNKVVETVTKETGVKVEKVQTSSISKPNNTAKTVEVAVAKSEKAPAKTTAVKEEPKKEVAKQTPKTENKPVAENKKESQKAEATKPAKAETKPAEKQVEKTPEKPKEQPKEKQKVWVVDKPAYDETVTKTRTVTETAYRPTWWIRFRGSDERVKYYDESKWDYDCENAENVSQYGNGEDEEYTVTKEVPYTETIHHEEVGHWEYK